MLCMLVEAPFAEEDEELELEKLILVVEAQGRSKRGYSLALLVTVVL